VHRSLPVLLAALLVAACGSDDERWRDHTGHGLLVVVVDGLWPDHVQALGYDRPTTPVLDRLIAEGATFRQTFTASPLLLPGHIGLLTGCDPSLARRYTAGEIDGLDERRWHVPARVPRLAVELLGRGFETAAFLNSELLEPVHGIDMGFQEVVVVRPSEDSEDQDSTRLVIERALQWLHERDRERPWLAYVHLNLLDHFWGEPDPAWESYFPPREELSEVPPVGSTDETFFALPRGRWKGAARTLGYYEAAYDGHLRKLDGELERLLADLERNGREEGTTVVVVGSTGMQFGESGLYLSSGRYSIPDLHVPWIVRPRRDLGFVGGRSFDDLASTLDLAPTLLGLEGIQPTATMHGRSLAALFQGGTPPPRDFVHASSGLQEGCAILGPRYCLELLVPGILENDQLVRCWTGEPNEHDQSKMSRFYDRLENPLPPLGVVVRDGTPEDLRRFQVEASAWVKDMEDCRTFLQARGPAFDLLGEETIRRLRERGYVGNPR